MVQHMQRAFLGAPNIFHVESPREDNILLGPRDVQKKLFTDVQTRRSLGRNR